MDERLYEVVVDLSLVSYKGSGDFPRDRFSSFIECDTLASFDPISINHAINQHATYYCIHAYRYVWMHVMHAACQSNYPNAMHL